MVVVIFFSAFFFSHIFRYILYATSIFTSPYLWNQFPSSPLNFSPPSYDTRVPARRRCCASRSVRLRAGRVSHRPPPATRQRANAPFEEETKPVLPPIDPFVPIDPVDPREPDCWWLFCYPIVVTCAFLATLLLCGGCGWYCMGQT